MWVKYRHVKQKKIRQKTLRFRREKKSYKEALLSVDEVKEDINWIKLSR